MMLELKNIDKSVLFNKQKIEILKNLNLNIEYGEITAITGNSGSGKSTLINILALIDTPDSGEYFIDGEDAGIWTNKEKAAFRAVKAGIIFQQYNLITGMNVRENIRLPLYVNNGIKYNERERIIQKSLKILYMEHRQYHYPKTLSGGEQQRVATARALANNPKIIFADEPTGNIDSKNKEVILSAFKKMSGEGRAVVIVTHDDEIENFADRVFKIEKGELKNIK